MSICSAVTIYRKSLTPNGIVWHKDTYNAFSILDKHITRENTGSTDASGEITIRIKTGTSICKAGDMIELADSKSTTPTDNAYEIASVTENFKGSSYMHHVKILAR